MSHDATAHEHPSNRFYVLIAVVLAVLTALEVAVFYVEAMASVLLPVLMVLMVAKFALVVMFFMHLKFDSKVLTVVFVWGLFIAVCIIMALMAVNGKFS
jgi:cytochrome c oxidase subunit 4